MEATRIIAVRHGETDWNATARIQGQQDVCLNERGHWQARQVARALAGEPLAAIYTSDLQRAWATAEPLARAARLSPLPDAGLRERHFGDFEGRTFRQIEQELPDDARAWRSRVPEWRPPQGGESLLQLRERVSQTVHRIARRHAGEAIVMVAHGGVLDALYRVATGQVVNSPRTWELPNGAINRLLWTPGGIAVIGWCDTQHLDNGFLDETTA